MLSDRMNTPLTLGFSPCPNDCFIFDALIHGKIDTEGLAFKVTMTDVEELNRKAIEGTIDITKLSYHAFAHLTDKYVLLDSGSALGKGCGPILIEKEKVGSREPGVGSKKEEVGSPESGVRSKKEEGRSRESEVGSKKEDAGRRELGVNNKTIDALTIAIPGKYTTANLLFSLAYPNAKNKVELVFSDIEDAVVSGKVDAGVIIHENRFTYEDKGLKKIIDLGEYWEQLTQLPIPLGGIVMKRSIDKTIQQKINRVLRKSVEYAFANPTSSRNFVKAHAQELSDEVINKHIQLYVNNYSLDLGEDGKKAIYLLFEKAWKLGIIPIQLKFPKIGNRFLRH